MLRWLVAPVAVLALSSGASAGTFDPNNYAGTWTGNWKNLRFKSTGPITATVTVADDGQSFDVEYNISLFGGCGSGTVRRTFVKGTDYADKSFRFSTQNAAFGTASFSSKATPGGFLVRGKGTGTCNPSVASFRLNGKLSKKRLGGKMTFKFGRSPVTTTFSAKRQ